MPEAWRDLHGIVTTGDCPKCDDELIALHDTPEYAALVERIRAEANIADRPGQYKRLNRIALDLADLALPCPCGCPTEAHIGEIGCACGLPGEPPCAPIRPGQADPQ